ncbi:MAG TPA: hypothetical protein PLN21_03080 [Gemmatales bacterium]|nr:hypothetical protein [Gemmatales bacterium]
MMFAAFNVETNFPDLQRMWEYGELWLRKAGIGSVIILFIWGLWFILKAALRDGKWVPYGITGRLDSEGSGNNWRARVFWILLGLTGISFAVGLAYFFYQLFVTGDFFDPFDIVKKDNTPVTLITHAIINFFCGLALLTLSIEFLFDVFRFSPRRLVAIARFSIKEAIRRKVLWVFLILGVVILFASWFITTDKKADQWQQYINLVFYVVTTMVLVTTGILACFSLPTDIKQQTIFTVVTKPVQKLEIMLGRILGLVFLMTLILFIAASISLIYVARGVDPEVAKTIRARNVANGALRFREIDEQGKTIFAERGRSSIGRVWEYFQYLAGGTSQEAIWFFPNLPAEIARQDKVLVESTFDIFRTSKGGDKVEEGVPVQFYFVNSKKWNNKFEEYRNARDPKTGLPLTPDEKARKFGYYELPKPARVYDEGEPTRVSFPGSIMADSPPGAVLEVHINCRASSQYLGVAERNLYLLLQEGNWVWNFYKGMIGVWFFMILVVILGTVLSTYLNAPISLLVTILIIILGQPAILKYIDEQAQPDDPVNRPGGRVFESAYRLANKENMVTQLQDSTATRAVVALDSSTRYFFKLIHAALPDVDIYDRKLFVAEGFSIPMNEMIAAFLRLVMYSFPLLLLGYFLLSGREIAN